jgi:hypothetical protein
VRFGESTAVGVRCLQPGDSEQRRAVIHGRDLLIRPDFDLFTIIDGGDSVAVSTLVSELFLLSHHSG